MSNHSPLQHLALVSESPGLGFAELARVSAALQKQAMRDIGPAWGPRATVDSFATLEDVPIDYWPIIIRDDIEVNDASGIHLDNSGHPFALAQFSKGWSLTASHEMAEMLCDPLGNTVRAGPSPMPGQQRVEFLVEVCDPSEAAEFAYSVNGVLVSDFYTPHYFDPKPVVGVRYSFTGAINKPRQVLRGGYLSWHDPVTDHWFQQTFFGAAPEFRDLGVLAQSAGSIRRQIYQRTPKAFTTRVPQGSMALMASGGIGMASESGGPRAQRLRAHIDTLVAKK